MNFQLNSKSIFLTFPQCEYPLSDFHSAIVTLFGPNLLHGVCSQETHLDGNHHLHAAITLKEPFRSRNVRVFDDLVSPSKHPNIDSRFKGGMKKAYRYVMKEGTYLPLPDETKCDLSTLLKMKRKDSMSLEIIAKIQDGATLDELDDTHPSYLLLHQAQVERYLNFRQLKMKRREFAEAQRMLVRVMPAADFSSSWNAEIASWLNRNLRTKRAHRQKQLWIQAPPAAGKTSMLIWLENTFKLSIYYWPKDEKWWDGYCDGAFDLIVLDEYRAQKMITELNPVLSGDPTPLSRRNAPPLVKRDILPVIILSNFHPSCCYSKCSESQLAPLLDRLEFVEVPEGGLIRLEELTDILPATQPVYDTNVFDEDDILISQDISLRDDETLFSELNNWNWCHERAQESAARRALLINKH